MRYLAELPLAPDAILHNAELHWREAGPDKLAVSAGSGETVSEVVLSLDSEGRVGGAFAPDWPALGDGAVSADSLAGPVYRVSPA